MYVNCIYLMFLPFPVISLRTQTLRDFQDTPECSFLAMRWFTRTLYPSAAAPLPSLLHHSRVDAAVPQLVLIGCCVLMHHGSFGDIKVRRENPGVDRFPVKMGRSRPSADRLGSSVLGKICSVLSVNGSDGKWKHVNHTLGSYTEGQKNAICSARDSLTSDCSVILLAGCPVGRLRWGSW